jgi:hypothetical protein
MILGFRLDTTVLMIKVVSEKLDCVMECSNEPCCRSINYKISPTLKNEPNCEILHNVVYNTSENALERSSSYDHVYLANSEKVREETSNSINLVSKSYNYLRNIKHFPCFYKVIETRVEVWEKREIAWEHEHKKVRVFPRNFEFLSNFHKCFYKLYKNTENVFYFLY